MDEIKPGVPDIIEPLTAEMERRGIELALIEQFCTLWRQLQPNSKILPCPLCFAKGFVSKLAVHPKDYYGNTVVRCAGCNAEIVVERVN